MEAGIAVSLSQDLIAHVATLYRASMRESSGDGINRRTDFAIPGVIVAVAAMEAYLNEAFLGPIMKDAPLAANLPGKWHEELDHLAVGEKLIEAPKLLLGETLDGGREPVQSMTDLISLRNDVVHYRMVPKTPKCVAQLVRRQYTLAVGDPTMWVSAVSCTETLRWAHNTVCDTVQAIRKLFPTGAHLLFQGLGRTFDRISDSEAKRLARG